MQLEMGRPNSRSFVLELTPHLWFQMASGVQRNITGKSSSSEKNFFSQIQEFASHSDQRPWSQSVGLYRLRLFVPLWALLTMTSHCSLLDFFKFLCVCVCDYNMLTSFSLSLFSFFCSSSPTYSSLFSLKFTTSFF